MNDLDGLKRIWRSTFDLNMNLTTRRVSDHGIARLRGADVTFVRVRGSHVDHYARKYPDFTSPRTLCGEPATPTWCYVHKTSKRGTVVTEWTEDRRPCRRCAVRLEKERAQ